MNTPWMPFQALDTATFRELRREAIFSCCKWDPQVGDVSVLSPFPLVLDASEWRSLSSQTEALAAETVAAEAELLQRPELHRELGLNRTLRAAMAAPTSQDHLAAHPRLMRFDFHFTTEGWLISEVNSDVPGGFNEASGFSKLMAGHYPGLQLAGDPAAALALALHQHAGRSEPVIGLVHATAYSDDRQVMAYLQQELAALGARSIFLGPDHLDWRNGQARARTEWDQSDVDAVFRFFPAEWLPSLPKSCQWQHYFRGSQIPLCNPASALLTQSKRFPLVWEHLHTALPTWRSLLPETHPVSNLFKPGDPAWVFKPVWGRVGDSIGMSGVTAQKDWQKIKRSLWWHARDWVVQKRFATVPIHAGSGPAYPCLGIYTVDGKVAGAYGRLSHNPLINHLAVDAAILISPETPAMSSTKGTAHYACT